jgi:polyphosphate kinase 2 (PPK2 family)
VASLRDADLRLKLTKRESEQRVIAAQRRLLALRLQLGGLIGGHELGPPLCVLFEGWDAAGKGGSIRRLVSPMDPRHVRVAQYAAPTADERRHHFLHRFAPALPGWGGMAVLDRSWYGRVLVERVERLATKEQWSRAYDEISGFEHTLSAEGMIIVKFWLHISSAEQLRRFKRREKDPLKRWKLTDEDWRNRKKRADYEEAVEEMLQRTDHREAPWHVVAAESKHYARVSALEIVISTIEDALRAAGRDPVDHEAAL